MIRKLCSSVNRSIVTTLIMSAVIAVFLSYHLEKRNPTPMVVAQTGSIPAGDQPDTAVSHDVTMYENFLPLIRSSYTVFLPLVKYDNSAPEVSNPFPAVDATRQSLNVYLAWSNTDDIEGDEYIFEVYLEANNDMPGELIGETENSFLDPFFAFELDTKYYWQVVAVDARGAREEGPIWSFISEDMPDPPLVGEMVYIPAGEFRMGCDQNNPFEITCPGRQTPLHTVLLDAYEIDKYEVTNQQYKACVDAGVCNRPLLSRSLSRSSYFHNSEYDYYPVLFVSWGDAQDYCGWADKRLPTEAEWEKAARGSIDTRVWPWGNEAPDCTRLNFVDNSNEDWIICDEYDTVRVGKFPAGASPYGAMDMGGNVFEWVSDLFSWHYYDDSPYHNPTGPAVQTHDDIQPGYDPPIYSLRGGSYRPNWYYSRIAHRHWGHHGPEQDDNDAPYYRNDQAGFRCARSPEE